MSSYPTTPPSNGVVPTAPFTQADPGSLDSVQSTSIDTPELTPTPVKQKRVIPWQVLLPVAILLLTIVSVIVILIASGNTRRMNAAEVAYATQQINLSSLEAETPSTDLSGTLTVNGELAVAGSLNVSPGSKPVDPKAGQIYYDESSRQLGYHNGDGFVYLQGGSLTAGDTTNVTNVTNITQGGDTTVNNNNITVNNITIISGETEPTVLLQGNSPGTVQTGNFAINGKGTMNAADIMTATINNASIASSTIGTAAIENASITTGTVSTANISTGNITTGNITYLNTANVDSGGNTFAVNQYEPIPGGQAARAGYTGIGASTSMPVGMFGTKVSTGSSGGPLNSVSVYIGNAYRYNTISGASGPALNAGFQIGIYSDNGDLINNRPQTLLAEAGPFYANDGDFALNSWNTLPAPNLPLQPFTNYWIIFYVPGVWSGYDAIEFKYKTNTNDGNSSTVTDQSWCSWSAWGMPSSGPLATCFGGTGPYYAKTDYSTYLNYTTDPSTGGAGAMFSLSSSGQASFRATEDSLNAFKIQNAASATTIFNVDTYNMRVAIGKPTADYLLDIGNGDVNMVGGRSLRFNGTKVLTATSSSTLLEGTSITLQGSATTITGAATFSGTTTHTGAATFAAAATFGGATTVNNTLATRISSANAFRIQNTSATDLFVANTTNMTISVMGTDLAFASLTLHDTHFKSTQTTKPTIAAPINCGSNATATVTDGSTDSAGSFAIRTGTDGTSSTCDTTLTFRRAYGSVPKSIIIVGKGSAAAAQRGIYILSSSTTTLTTSFANSTLGADAETYEFNYWIIE